MMAAAQPFLSGAISKTVNLPNSATVEDIMQTYIEAWKLGLKAVAIYRDGSKRSAPLNVKKNKDMGTVEATRRGRGSPRRACVAPAKPMRRRMSDTRVSITHKFDIAGHEGYLTVGLFDDDKQPGELFITMAKEGSTIGGLMDTIGTLVSLALQYGVPVEAHGEEIRPHALRAERLHQEPRHPQREVDHRLHLPLDGHPVHPRLPRGQQPERRPAGTPHQGNPARSKRRR